MITRIIIPLLLLIALPDLYLHHHYLRRRTGYGAVRRLLWWLPASLLLVYAVVLSLSADFAPDPIHILYLFLLLLGLLVVPKAIFSLCSVLGLAACRLRKSRRNWGNLLGLVLGILAIYVILYGSFIGPRQMVVKQQTITSPDLPATFDGYRIALLSDIHAGSLSHIGYSVLQRAIDSINSQHPDMICFTGDLQNLRPSELDPVLPMLSQLKATDGVFSILGNHDYTNYIAADSAEIAVNETLTQAKQRSMGWQLLMNERRVIRRGNDSIVVAGTEDDCKPPQQTRLKRSDYEKTLQGVKPEAFTVMLQHNPQEWRKIILPQTSAQLTLSGHTHGGQVRLFGWSPISLVSKEWGGLYTEGRRSLYVTTGVSGLVPFRFGMPPEVVIITLQ